MKRKIITSLLLLSIGIGCSDDHAPSRPAAEGRTHIATDVIPAIDDLAKTVAYALREKIFRDFVKMEAMKRFDYDYDILYDIVKNKTLDNTTVEEFLVQKYSELQRDGIVASSLNFRQLVEVPQNFQISVPIACDRWDTGTTNLDVIANVYNFTQAESLDAYDQALTKKTYMLTQEVDQPVVVVGESERVDKNGKLLVDRHHIVVPEAFRISARDAYLIAETSRVGRVAAEDAFIQIIDDEKDVPGISESYSTTPENIDQRGSSKDNRDIPNARTNAVLATPVLDVRYNITPRTVTLNWIGDVNATGYEVWLDQGAGYQLFGNSTIESLTIPNLTPEALYRFRVRGFDSQGFSLLSNEAEIRPSALADNSEEFIRRIYITNSRMDQIEPGIFGAAELEVQIVKSYVVNANSPSSTNVLSNTFYREPSLIAGTDKWLYYEIPLGSWRTEDNTHIINLVWQEFDGNQDVLKSYDVTVSSELGFSQNIADKLSFGITGKRSRQTVYHYEVQKTYFIIGSMPVFFYENPNRIYNLDGFMWRMRNSGESLCPYIGGYDGVDCLVGTAPAYPFPVLSSSVAIENGLFTYMYRSTAANAGNCSLPGSTLISVTPYILSYRTTKCSFGPVPSGADAYVNGDNWYVRTN